MKVKNGYTITVSSVSQKLPMLFAVYVHAPAPQRSEAPNDKPAFVGYNNQTHNGVEFLLRLVQTDPEKVMSRNC